ncbi:MAG: hypothetical protein IKQ59_11745 [Prevotella sp.]|nr:hypothetical protein [Prevotella sp.]
MKVTEQDIARTARQMRDEENEQLNIQPWNRHRRHHLPTWIVAIPAAAIIGFVFGFWTKSANQLDAPLTALVDTIYIKVHDPQPRQDTIAQVIPAVQTPARPRGFVRSRGTANPASSRPKPILGRPVSDDHIRYDLLVRN